MACGKQARNRADKNERIKAAAHANHRALLRPMMAASRQMHLSVKEKLPFKEKENREFLATLLQPGTLRLTVSPTFLYKKLDECGKGHLDTIFDEIEKEGKSLDIIRNPNEAVVPGVSRKVVTDNFNYYAQPHELTLERRNESVNWVATMITENRLSGYGLSDKTPDISVMFNCPNGSFLPNEVESCQQRAN
eukprot:gene10454-11549_t